VGDGALDGFVFLMVSVSNLIGLCCSPRPAEKLLGQIGSELKAFHEEVRP
jgi:hypothetical protein